MDGDKVIVTCFVPRISGSHVSLHMYWHGNKYRHTEINNRDGSYGYIVRMTKIVGMEHDGSQIKCVLAQIGKEKITEVRNITVECK